MKPRAAWPVLVKKAKENCDDARVIMVKARDRLRGLQENRQRMQMLYEDYVHRSREVERKSHTISESQNFRSFIQQIQSLLVRLDVDLDLAQKELETAKAELLAAEIKRVKMESLMEQDLKAVAAFQRRREQKEMDAAGVTLYNLKS